MATVAVPAKRRVLVVDDEDVVRATTVLALERKGFDVIAVASGAEALAYLARDTPALMLLDLNMHDMSGWEVLSLVQHEPRLSAMRTVIVSGERATVPRRFGYLRKPFKIDALLEML